MTASARKKLLFSVSVLVLLVGWRMDAGAQPTTIITNVTVISGATAAPQPGMTVTVRNGRIASIERGAPVSTSANVIDGSGKFLMPGLWDMHVHLTLATDLAAPLMLAAGVTGARDMGGDLATVDWLRRRIEHGDVAGPRVFRAGPLVDGNKPGVPNRVVIASAAEARRAAALLREHGVDFIKVHNGAPPEPYFALLAEARRLGMRVTGHIPLEVDPMQAIDSGHYSIEHIVSLFEGPVTQKTKTGKTQEQAIAEFTDDDARRSRGAWLPEERGSTLRS